MLNPNLGSQQSGFTIMNEHQNNFASAVPQRVPSSSTLSTASTVSSPMVESNVDTDNVTASNRTGPPCFWALLSNSDLRFVYVSQNTTPDHGQVTSTTEPVSTASSATQMAVDTNDDHIMTDVEGSSIADASLGNSINNLQIDTRRHLPHYHHHQQQQHHHPHVASNVHNRSDAGRATNQDYQCLVGTSFFEHIHSEEVVAARADLGHFVAQKTLYGSITRCRFRIPKATIIDHRATGMAVSGPSHGRHLTPLSTPTAAQSTGYFDSSLMSKTWQGQHEKSMAPTLPALTIGMRSIDQQSHQQQQQQRSQPSLSTNNDSSQEYVVMDITMNVTCDTLALAFFHVVDDNNGKNCCDTSFTSKDAELLLKKLNGLSPPITPIKSRIATSAVCATPISTRVLQILSATTGQVLFLYPSDNLHRLAAGTELPPADVNDWCSRLFYPSDYRNLHDKTMAAAQDTLGKGHMACRHVCSRLRFVTVHGTRVAECVATRWGSLIFICTQLIGSEAEVVNRDDIGGGLGETRFVTPVGPFGVSFSTQSMLSSSSSTNSSANVTDHVDSLMPARTFNEDRSLPAQMSSTESNIITRCQSVPDFMAHRADNPAPRPSLSRLATTTAVNMWPTTSASSSASTGHSISVAGALPLIPQTPAHLATASLVHTNSLSSSYGSTIGVHPSYYQHGADSTDLMMWSEETRMSHGTPTTPTAPSFIQKPGSSHPMHTQSAPFSLALRQRESSQHNYGGMSSNSNHGSSNGGGSSSSGNSNTENKQCEQCGTMRSPEWRRGPSGHKTLCNACGLRYSRSLARAGKSAQNQRSTTTLGSQSSSGQRQLESSAMEIRSTMNHADNRPAPMILTSTPTFSPHYSAPSTPTSLSSTGNTATLPSSMAGRAGPMDIHSMSHSHPHSHSHHLSAYHVTHSVPTSSHYGAGVTSSATSIEHTAAVHLMNPGALQSGYATNSMITTPHHYATAYSADTIRNPSIMGVSSDMSKVDPRDIHHA